VKFSQLPIGTLFEWEGGVWCKVGPITASLREGGGQRVIPRSTSTRPLQSGAIDAAPRPPREIPFRLLEDALADYTRELLALLDAYGDQAGLGQRLGEVEARLVARYSALAAGRGESAGTREGRG